jgi:hypothetical protein
MKLATFGVACLITVVATDLKGQISDRCSPGWSTLNRLREQLTSETSNDNLNLLYVRIQKDLNNCREIPDLWYYRALVAERLGDKKDAVYARKQAESGGSEALSTGVNPFEGIRDAQPSELSGQIRDKYALVVGINEFENAPPLRFAVNDAKSFADALMSLEPGHFQKDHVFRLLDGEATLNGVRTAIGRIRQRAQADDLVVVYIASHGSPRESDPNGVSYILLHDTKIDSAATVYATSLQMIDLVESLRRDIRATRLVLILDTCYSGDATGVRGLVVHSTDKSLGPESEFSAAVDRFDDKTAKGRARVVISASRANEPSREDEMLGHGYFTYFLLDSLRSSAGARTLGEVFESVHDRVIREVRDRYKASQTPTIRSSPEGLQIALGAAVQAQ